MKPLNSKKYLVLLLGLLLMPLACEEQLDITNPNNPTPDIVLSEEGMKRQAVGIWDAPGGFWEWVGWSLMEAMGDNIVMPWTNFDWNRFFGNIELIEYSDGTDDWSPRIQASPSRTQAEWVNFVNDRQVTQGGYEALWLTAYGFNTEANRMLQALDNGVAFTGNIQAKENAYRAWAHFWKGYAYSLVGLFYEQGVVNNDPTGTNSDFKTSAEMIAASQAELDLALQFAADFGVIANDVVPNIFPTSLTTASFIQNIHTLKARNLLMSKRREAISATEWQQIKDWAEDGLMANDGALLFDSDESTHLSSITHRWRLSTNVWHRVSPRVIQILSENGDQRLNRFQFTTAGGSFANRTTRPQINSPWLTLSGTPYASASPGTPQYVLSAEENMLMLAEAELGLGNPGPAAGWVNTVREMPLQGAGLADESSVTMQDIRNERKVALFGRALAFYDARRLGEIDARAEGGGVTGVWVYHIDSGGNLVLDDNANLYFDFLSYYAIPDAEADFNISDDAGPEM
jgi:hypothetical protein